MKQKTTIPTPQEYLNGLLSSNVTNKTYRTSLGITNYTFNTKVKVLFSPEQLRTFTEYEAHQRTIFLKRACDKASTCDRSFMQTDEYKEMQRRNTHKAIARKKAEDPDYILKRNAKIKASSLTPESRLKHSIAGRTRHKSHEELSAIMTNTNIKRYQEHPELLEGHSKRFKHMHETGTGVASPEARDKVSTSLKQYYIDHPEVLEAMSIRVKHQIETGTGIASPEAIKKTKPYRVSNIERKFAKALADMGYRVINDVPEVNRQVLKGTCASGMEIDIYLPDYKFGIEVDGERWHKNDMDNGRRARKDMGATEAGITLVHIIDRDWDIYSRTGFNKALQHITSMLHSAK